MLCTVHAATNCTTDAHKPVLNINLSGVEACPKSRKSAHKPWLLYIVKISDCFHYIIKLLCYVVKLAGMIC